MEQEFYGDELWQLVPKRLDEEIGDFIARTTKWQCERWPENVYICEDDGVIVGYMLVELRPEQGYGEIGINALIPEYRGRGLGQEMYRAAFDRFRQEGLKFATVDTGLIPEDNLARTAYERAGFQVLTGQVRYYQRL